MERAEPLTGAEPHRRGLIAGAAAASLAGIARAEPALSLAGRPQQGGYLIGRAAPRGAVTLGADLDIAASKDGWFLLGFDRDSGPSEALRVQGPGGVARRTLAIAPTDYDVQRIDGLPESQVSPTDPALLARIQREAARKAVGFASRVDADDFKSGFSMPLKTWRLSGRFGGQRILNGVPKRPHYGADLAAPVGQPIFAPAAGTVSFAETGLHFEGGLTMIDHGQGLISLYLHQSRIDVRAGQRVAAGQQIGAVGKEGRATGPHLCWRLKWRGRNLDPMLMVGASRPV